MTNQDKLEKIIYENANSQRTGNQESLRDILTDLRHIAARDGLDFDKALEGSEEVWREEVELAPSKIRIRKGSLSGPEEWISVGWSLTSRGYWTTNYDNAATFTSQDEADKVAKSLGLTDYGLF